MNLPKPILDGATLADGAGLSAIATEGTSDLAKSIYRSAREATISGHGLHRWPYRLAALDYAAATFATAFTTQEALNTTWFRERLCWLWRLVPSRGFIASVKGAAGSDDWACTAGVHGALECRHPPCEIGLAWLPRLGISGAAQGALEIG